MTVLNERDKEIIRDFLTERRNKLVTSIADMQTSLQEVDVLLLAVSETKSSPVKSVVSQKNQLILEALIAAGEDGLTAMEASRITDMPLGTASGVMSKMKKDGNATHIQPRYFIRVPIAKRKPKTAIKPVVPYISIIVDELGKAGEAGLTSAGVASKLKERGIERNSSQVRSLVSHAVMSGKIRKINDTLILASQQPTALETVSTT